jgi:hypothetical protein
MCGPSSLSSNLRGYSRVAAVLTVVVVFTLSSASVVTAEVIFDNTPSPLPGNVVSEGFQATQTAELGNEISFAGSSRNLTSVNIVMSDWANQADYPGVGDATGYDHPITVNLYNPGSGPSVGSLIASRTQTVHVPWHTANGFNGVAFPVSFNFTGVTVPNTVIFGVAYNTQTWGASPIGAAGPYNSLNFGLADVGPTVGTDVNPDDAYWNTMTASNYTDGGAAGVGVFRQDTGWTPYSGMIQVNAVPEPASAALIALGSLMVSCGWKRSRS